MSPADAMVDDSRRQRRHASMQQTRSTAASTHRAQKEKSTQDSVAPWSSSILIKDTTPIPTAPTEKTEIAPTAQQLDQRNKQIQFGKNLVGYKNYCHHVPKESRDENNERHPFTPKARKSGSKRAFAGTLKAWKKALHLWDEEGPFNNEKVAATSVVTSTTATAKKKKLSLPPSSGSSSSPSPSPSSTGSASLLPTLLPWQPTSSDSYYQMQQEELFLQQQRIQAATTALWQQQQQQKIMMMQMQMMGTFPHQNDMNANNNLSHSQRTMQGMQGVQGMQAMQGMYGMNSMHGMNYSGMSGVHGMNYSGKNNNRGRKERRRSSTVEAWKNSDDRNLWKLERIAGHLARFAQDATGTHFMQSCFDDASASQIVVVYQELASSSMSTLVLHPTGNWTIKKLVETLQAHELELFFQHYVHGKVNLLSYHVHGARVLKAALIRAAKLRTRKLVSSAIHILNDLSTDLARAMCHESATHIFQRSFNVLIDDVDRSVIVKKITATSSEDVVRIGTHTFGSRALQCVIGTCAQEVGSALLSVAPSLALSAAGNFVLQSMLQNGTAGIRRNLVSCATFHLGQFSCNKHASHFVERCIDMASEEELTFMVSTMLTMVNGVPIMVGMCNNSYANFVVGSIVARLQHTGQASLKEALSNIMKMWEQQMRTTNIGDKTYCQSLAALSK